MGLFSFFRKSKQESTSSEGEFYSRAEEASNAIRGRGKRGATKGATGKQAGEPADPVLPEKKRARRRLVGAIALVLAVVIVLPMILDSVPKPISGDIEIQIPSKDKPFQSGKSPLPASAQFLSETKENIVESDAVDIDKTELDVAEEVAAVTPADIKKTNEPKSSGVDKVITTTADHKTDPKIAPKSEQKLVPAPIAPVDKDFSPEAARAHAILEGKAVVNPDVKGNEGSAGKKSEKFVVQVAALASQEKVSELQGKLQSAGIKSFTQKIATQSGERIRVRVGPFTSKAEAERMRAKLVKSGLNGTLVPV